MGSRAEHWASQIKKIAGEGLMLEVARLPAEGIRRFEATPPDAIVVVEESGEARARALIKAIQNRPLGELLPLLLIARLPDDASTPQQAAQQLGIHAWYSPQTPPHELVAELARALEVALPLHEPVPGGGEAAFEQHDEFLIEALSEEELEEHTRAPLRPPSLPSERAERARQEDEARPQVAPPAAQADYSPPSQPIAHVTRHSLFPVRARAVHIGEVSEESLRRKLKEARHDDYYTLLEVRRGAETAIIRDAFQRLMARFEPEHLDFDLVRRFYEEVAEIQDALEDAWAVLGDAELRQRYLLASQDGAGR